MTIWLELLGQILQVCMGWIFNINWEPKSYSWISYALCKLGIPMRLNIAVHLSLSQTAWEHLDSTSNTFWVQHTGYYEKFLQSFNILHVYNITLIRQSKGYMMYRHSWPTVWWNFIVAPKILYNQFWPKVWAVSGFDVCCKGSVVSQGESSLQLTKRTDKLENDEGRNSWLGNDHLKVSSTIISLTRIHLFPSLWNNAQNLHGGGFHRSKIHH